MIWVWVKRSRLYPSYPSLSSLRKLKDHILLSHQKLHWEIGKMSSKNGYLVVKL